MATTSWTEADIATLEAAIASGTTSVTFTSGGVSRSRTYQSTDAMLKALAVMKQQVRGNGGSYRLAASRKGL